VQNQPTDQTPELPDEQAPDQDAAPIRIREVGSTLRQALGADEQLAGATEQTGR
jgi:hypothetical protein